MRAALVLLLALSGCSAVQPVVNPVDAIVAETVAGSGYTVRARLPLERVA